MQLNLVDENFTISGKSYGKIILASDGTNIYYRGIST